MSDKNVEGVNSSERFHTILMAKLRYKRETFKTIVVKENIESDDNRHTSQKIVENVRSFLKASTIDTQVKKSARVSGLS